MPFFDRLRVRHSGVGVGGSSVFTYLADGELPVDDPPKRSPTELFVRESMLDSSKSHLDAYGAELWHDLYREVFRYDRLPLLSGVHYDGEEEYPHTNYETFPWDGIISRGIDTPYREVEESSWGSRREVDLLDVIDVDEDSSLPQSHIDLSTLVSPLSVLMAEVHPLSKTVDIPSSAIETLKDLPALVLLKGNNLIETSAKVNLAFQFGWKPLISDVKSILRLGRELNKRLRTLSDLENASLYTAKGKIQRHSGSSTYTTSFDLGFASHDEVTYLIKKETVLDQWGALGFAVPPSFQEYLRGLSVDDGRWVALQSLTGLYLDNPSALWELLPWSWLIDWFIPVQSALERYKNETYLVPNKAALMTKRSTTFTCQAVSVSGHNSLDLDSLSFSGSRTTLLREVFDPATLPYLPTPTLPILDARRVGILASLVGLRRQLYRLLL